MKILLHVGLHKTGTSYIQSVLRKNSDLLRQCGVCYPSSPGNAHHDFASALKIKNVPLAEEIFNGYLLEAREDQAHTLLISSEVLSEFWETEDLKQILGGHDIIIVLVLREPLSLFQSAFNQLIREPSVRRYKEIKDGNVYELDYEKHAEKWESCFGKSAIRVFSYERLKALGKSGILSPFITLLGLQSLDTEIEKRGANESVDPISLESIRLLNAYELPLESHQHMVDALGSLKMRKGYEVPSAALLSVEESVELLVEFLPKMNRVLTRYGEQELSLEGQLRALLDIPARSKAMQELAIIRIIAASWNALDARLMKLEKSGDKR